MIQKKNYHDTFFHKVKRLLFAIFLQALWLLPLIAIGYYIKQNLNTWFMDFFGVPKAQETAKILAERVTRYSDPIVINPSTATAYLKAIIPSIGADTKASMLTSFASISTSLFSLLINIIDVLLVIYAFFRARTAYRTYSHEARLSNQICREIIPELDEIKRQLTQLQKALENKMPAIETEELQSDPTSSP